MNGASAETYSTNGEVESIDVTLSTLPSGAIESITRGEIDIQIATAKRYPRSLAVFQQRAISMATLDEETAESCIYRRPVGKKKNAKGKWEEEYAEGMSIRMAEIVGASYGNLRVNAMLIEQTPEYVRARGMAIDLETNFASSSEVIESTLTKDGKPFSPRMRIIVAKACLAKARRDATFQVVPKALAKPVEIAVRHILLGDQETIEKRRNNVSAWISKLGISQDRVYASLGISGPSDMTVKILETLTGIKTAIRDGEISPDDAFPIQTSPTSNVEDFKEALRNKAAQSTQQDSPQPAAQQGAAQPETGFGDAKSAVASFAALNVPPSHLTEKLGGKLPAQWVEADLATLKSIHDQIMGGMMPFEFFPNI